MKYWRYLYCFSASLLTISSCAIPVRPTHSSEVKVVNGQKIVSNDITPGANASVSIASKAGNGFSYFCSASIIGSKWVLTAQHCLEGRSSGDTYVIFADDINQAKFQSRIQWRAIEVIFRAPGHLPPNQAEHEWHPELKPGGRFQIRLKADLALIKITEEIPPGYSPARIPKQQNLNNGDELHFIGYGSSSPNFLGGGTRRTTKLRFTGQSFDGGLVSGVATHVLLLEKTITGEYICRGDSGGGAFRKLGETLFLVGVNSYTKGSNKPGAEYYDCEAGLAHVFYTPDYRPWIQSIMGDELAEP